MMAMEASSNSRVGLSSSTTTTALQLSVEQWELLRRLRNRHLTKTQIIRAYDELDRLDRELGNLFIVLQHLFLLHLNFHQHLLLFLQMILYTITTILTNFSTNISICNK